MKLVAVDKVDLYKEYLFAIKNCNGTYSPCFCTFTFGGGMYFKTREGVKLPYYAFAHVKTNKEGFFSFAYRLLFSFDDLNECNEWCKAQNN